METSAAFMAYQQLVFHPLKFRLFLLSRLPLVFFTGIRVKEMKPEQAIVSVKFKWLNQNPFHSIYFAVLAMAAELSTGSLCMGHLYQAKPPVSMLIVQMNASFQKKATGKILFTCTDGERIQSVIEKAKATGEGQMIECTSTGLNEQNEIVAVFKVIWSFKVKSK